MGFRYASGALLFAGLTAAGSQAADLNVQVVDTTGAPLANAVVVAHWADAPPPQAQQALVMAQRGRRFEPEVLVVPSGSGVEFPNNDSVLHHVYSFSPAKTFELELYAGKPEAPVVFDQPGIVTLGCNIHDQMKAYVLVLDGGLQARTDATGHAHLTGLPDTGVSLRVWHPRLKTVERWVPSTLPEPPWPHPWPLTLDVHGEAAPPPKTGLRSRFQRSEQY